MAGPRPNINPTQLEDLHTIQLFGCTLALRNQTPFRFSTPHVFSPFAVQQPETTPHYTLSFNQSTRHTPATEYVSAFEGNPFSNCHTDYRWLLFQTPHHEGIRIDYPSHPELKSAEVLLDQQGHIDLHLEFRELTLLKGTFNPNIFPLTNLLWSRILQRENGLMIHASGVAHEDRGYLFTAVSGTGKSTMAGLWKQMGAQIVNDDILAIVPKCGQAVMHNIPMPYYADVPKSAPLSAIFLLSQSPQNFITPVAGASALMRVMANCIQHFNTPQSVKLHLQNVQQLVGKIPIYELGFKPDTDIVTMIRHAAL